MSSRGRFGGRWAWWVAALAFVVLVGGGVAAWRWFAVSRPVYRDDFAQNRVDEWNAVGGAWRLAGGAMHNDSDERGAKMLTGSYRWTRLSAADGCGAAGRGWRRRRGGPVER